MSTAQSLGGIAAVGIAEDNSDADPRVERQVSYRDEGGATVLGALELIGAR